MSFTFAEIEGIDAELAAKLDADSTIIGAIESYKAASIEEGVNNRVDVAKGEFKKKMDALNAKLKEAEEQLSQSPNIKPDELKALREARDKNPELQATLEAMRKRTEEAEGKLKKQQEDLLQMQLGHTITQAMNEYDTAHPTLTVKSDMKDLVSMLARDALKFDEDAKTFRVYGKNGDIVATDKGAATPVDWLTMLRTERPSLFSAPAGSGAPGSKPTSGSAGKTLTRSEFGALSPMEQAKTARTHTITD
jgi:alanyl-tRNA synthetase